ncbi:hypothetical protein ACWCRD_27275 [Streptomyces sp. NPDC002092]
MSLPVIAIMISVVSALFTATNAGISYATYKRAKPKVEISCNWCTEDGWVYVRIDFVNKGMTPVRAEETSLEASPYLFPMPWSTRRWPYSLQADIVKGGEERSIEPFDGIKWIVRSARPVPYAERAETKRVRITATLTNGQSIRTQWLLYPTPSDLWRRFYEFDNQPEAE